MSHQPDNLSAGTQVVSLVEVRGTGDSMVHPRGAVGIVTRTPAANHAGNVPSPARDAKKIAQRFIAGSKATKISKVYPPRLATFYVAGRWAGRLSDGGRPSGGGYRLLITGAATSRESRVPVRVESHRERLLSIKHGELPWADVDAWRKNPPPQFLRQCSNLSAALMPTLGRATFPRSRRSAVGRDIFVENTFPKNHFSPVRGGIRTAIRCTPPPPREARVPVRVESHRERLLSIKRGELPWPDVDTWRKELHHDFENALTETKLPERPDYEAANRFLIGARRTLAQRD